MGVYSNVRLLVGVVSVVQSKDGSFALTKKILSFCWIYKIALGGGGGAKGCY